MAEFLNRLSAQASYLYDTPDLPGYRFKEPSKICQKFFAKKLSENDSFAYAAWRVAHVIASILPCIVAAIGMGIDLFGIPSLKADNEKAKISVGLINGMLVDGFSDFSTSSKLSMKGWEMTHVTEFKEELSRGKTESFVNGVNSAVDEQTKQYRRVYIAQHIATKNKIANITVKLCTFDPING
jgi:hypothetical protein